MFTRGFCFYHLAANSGRGLFASAGPSSERAIDVVVAGYSALQAEIFFKVAAHALAEKFFPAIAVLGKSRIRIFFLKRNHVRSFLLIAVVDARGRRIEKALDSLFPGQP